MPNLTGSYFGLVPSVYCTCGTDMVGYQYNYCSLLLITVLLSSSNNLGSQRPSFNYFCYFSINALSFFFAAIFFFL